MDELSGFLPFTEMLCLQAYKELEVLESGNKSQMDVEKIKVGIINGYSTPKNRQFFGIRSTSSIFFRMQRITHPSPGQDSVILLSLGAY